MAVPLYNGQPGTSVFGGAIPPPQSRKSHSSPVPGTYQARLAPAGEETSVLVQPLRSVLARTKGRREAEARIRVDRDMLVEVVSEIEVIARMTVRSMLLRAGFKCADLLSE